MRKVTLLVASDIHGKESIVNSFVEWVNKMNHSFDAIIIAGDIGNPQKPNVFCNILKKIASFKKPIYYVRGNWDVNYKKCNIGIDLEFSKLIEFDDFLLVGHGKRMKPHRHLKDKNKPIVLITHYPPYSIMDRGKRLESSQQSLHSGLPEINFLLDYYKPIVHIFGHSHSFGGIDWKINEVLYINVARLDRTAKDGTPIGNYALITIEGKNINVEWFFINGIWKNCSLCGKKYHLPKSWSICRKCANRNDLKFTQIDHKYSKLKITIYSRNNTGRDNFSFVRKVKVPIHTLKDYLALEDFLDILMIKLIVNELEKKYDKILIMPKDKLIEFYGKSQKGIIIPFSEYLFSCNEEIMGRRLCTLMKLFSLSKHVYVIWGFKNNVDEKYVLKDEYVLFSEKILNSTKEIESILHKNNFIPLLYKREFRDEQSMPKKIFESLRKILEKKK